MTVTRRWAGADCLWRMAPQLRQAPDEGLLAQILGKAPVTGQGKSQPHQLRIVTLVQLSQAIMAAGLHVGETAAPPKRLP
jgi:hypothetical protein